MARLDKGMLCVSIALMALGGYVAVGAAGSADPPGYSRVGPGFFPALVAAGLISVGAWLAFQCFRVARKNRNADVAEKGFSMRTFVWISAGAGMHMALIGTAGFVVASALLFTLVARAFGSRKWIRDAAIGLGLAAMTYLFFTHVVSINLPAGVLFETGT